MPLFLAYGPATSEGVRPSLYLDALTWYDARECARAQGWRLAPGGALETLPEGATAVPVPRCNPTPFELAAAHSEALQAQARAETILEVDRWLERWFDSPSALVQDYRRKFRGAE